MVVWHEKIESLSEKGGTGMRLLCQAQAKTENNKILINNISEDEHDVIIFKNNHVSDNILNYFNQNNVQFITLNTAYKNMNEKGLDPNYWKATNRYGHWNHLMQEEVGHYLRRKISDFE